MSIQTDNGLCLHGIQHLLSRLYCKAPWSVTTARITSPFYYSLVAPYTHVRLDTHWARCYPPVQNHTYVCALGHVVNKLGLRN